MFAYIHGHGSSKNGRSAKELKRLLALYNEVLEPLGYDSDAKFNSIYQSLLSQINELQKSLKNETLTLIGSSMGGYLSARFGMDLGLKCVLFNPAIQPHFANPSFVPLELDKEIKVLIFVSDQDELLEQNDKKVNTLFTNAKDAQIIITHTPHRVMDYMPYIEKILEFSKN